MPLSRRRFMTRSAAAAALAANAGQMARAQAAQTTGIAEAFGGAFTLGTAVSNSTLETRDQEMYDLISREFAAITAENCMKWGEIHPAEDEWDWTLADRFVEFGRQAGLQLVGHVLVWHSQIPQSVFEGPDGTMISREALERKMDTHIATLAGRYQGDIAIWDVVNEAVDEGNGWRRSPWYEVFGGPEYVERAFRQAREAAPDAQLICNDYNMHQPAKREFLVDVLRDYTARGVPITGVGMQGHIGLDYPAIEEFEANLEAYAATGMRMHVTEMEIDVLPAAWDYIGAEISEEFEYSDELNPYTDGLPGDVQQQLTDRYVQYFEMFLRHRDKIDRVSFWGTHDGESWKNDFPVTGRTNYPLLFDRDRQPKPAHAALIDLGRSEV